MAGATGTAALPDLPVPQDAVIDESIQPAAPFRLAGNATDGVICSIAGGDLSKMAGGAKFAKDLKAKFGHEPVVYSPSSYDAVHVIVDAMKRSKSTTRAGVLAATERELDVSPLDPGILERLAGGEQSHVLAGDAVEATEGVNADADNGDVQDRLL